MHRPLKSAELKYFDPIYDFYAAGKIHVPKDLCLEKFMAELRFWAVSKAKIDECCNPFSQFCIMKKMPTDQPADEELDIDKDLPAFLRPKKFDPLTALILGSLPEFQVPEEQRFAPDSGSAATYPTYPKVNGYTVSTTTVVKGTSEPKVVMVEHPVFNYVENICVAYFTIEYMLRLWVAPRKWAFVKEFLNVIDLLAIVPFIFEMMLQLVC
uniref:Ion transport domain-containing protein n=1 Tax=Acrobeloides nanus TaxID=290746 RepID=A0A914CVQ2_9BILA